MRDRYKIVKAGYEGTGLGREGAKTVQGLEKWEKESETYGHSKKPLEVFHGFTPGESSAPSGGISIREGVIFPSVLSPASSPEKRLWPNHPWNRIPRAGHEESRGTQNGLKEDVK